MYTPYNELFGQTIHSRDVVVLASFAFPAHPLVRIRRDAGRVQPRTEQGSNEFPRNIDTRARNHSRVRRTFEDDEPTYVDAVFQINSSLCKETMMSKIPFVDEFKLG